MTRWCLSVGLGVASLLPARVVRAQSVPGSGDREQLIDRGMQAVAAGDHAHAIELFAEAGRIEMRPGLRAALSQQYEALGNHREACEFATRAVDEARVDLSRPENGRALQAGAAVVSMACPQVGRVHLVFPAGGWRGTQVTVQGRAVDPEREDVSVAVDPGEVLVQAVAADGGNFRRVTTVPAGEAAEVRVAFQQLAPAVPVVRATVIVTPPPALPPVASSALTTPEEPSAQGPGAGPWILAGGGVLSLGLMGVFYGIESSALSSCTVQGSVAHCPPSMVGTASNTPTWALAGNVSLGVGLAAIAGGVIWWVVGRHAETAPVTVGVGQQGITVGGRF